MAKTAKDFLRNYFIEADSRSFDFKTVVEMMEEYRSQPKPKEISEEMQIQLRIDINHIFASGANEIRVFELCKKFAASLQAESKEQDKWISVEERLPERMALKIILMDGKYVTCGYLKDWHDWRASDDKPCKVTKWQPLPEAPQEKKPKN